MGVTDVLRGEDLLPSTPGSSPCTRRSPTLASRRRTPRFGHLPYVIGEGNKKLSKRDPQAKLDVYPERGFLPEGLANYLALLGWSIAEDRDIFSVAEMVEAFDITRVSANPARFDLKKAEAINATHLRALPGRVRRPGDAVPGRRRPDQRSARSPEQAAVLRGDRAAGPGADGRVVRGGRPAGLPVREDVEIDPAAAESSWGPAPLRCSTPPPQRWRPRGVAYGGDRGALKERSSRAWVASRGRRSARSGSRSAVAPCHRRWTSRSSCSAGSAPCAGWPPPAEAATG